MSHVMSIRLSLLLALSLATTAGCKKEEEGKKDDGPSQPAADDTAEMPAGGALSAPAGGLSAKAKRAAAGNSAIETGLPRDSAMVMSMNLRRARDTNAYKLYKKTIEAELDEPIADIKQACGLDLLAFDATISASLAGLTGPGKEDVTILVETAWDRATIDKCMTAIGVMKKSPIKIEDDGKITRYQPTKEKADPLVVAWLSNNAVLMHRDIHNDAKIRPIADGTSRLADNATLAPLLQTVNRDGLAWIVGVIPEDGKRKLSKLLANADPAGFYMSLDYTDNVSATFGVRFADAATAERAVTAAKGLLELSKARPEIKPFAPYMKALELSSKGPDFIATVNLSAADVASLMKQYGSKMGLPPVK